MLDSFRELPKTFALFEIIWSTLILLTDKFHSCKFLVKSKSSEFFDITQCQHPWRKSKYMDYI